MKPFSDLLQIVNEFHEQGQTIEAANFLVKEYGLENPNFKGFELREKAKPDFILMTAEGALGEPQLIRIPENTFEYSLELMLNLIAHEMVHVDQKTGVNIVEDKNEREWQAYYEMLFHKIFPQIPNISNFHKKFFSKKALEYYNRMGEGSDLQYKYAQQKIEVDNLLALLG